MCTLYAYCVNLICSANPLVSKWRYTYKHFEFTPFESDICVCVGVCMCLCSCVLLSPQVRMLCEPTSKHIWFCSVRINSHTSKCTNTPTYINLFFFSLSYCCYCFVIFLLLPLLLLRSFVRSLIHSFICLFIRLFICSYRNWWNIHSYTRTTATYTHTLTNAR